MDTLFYSMWCNTPLWHVFVLRFGKNENWWGTQPRPSQNVKTHCSISIKTYRTGLNSTIPPNRIYRYPFSTLYGVIHTMACFRSSAPKKTKTENVRPQNNKSHHISIKTYRTRLKLYNTSQSYWWIPLFYHMWCNTHYGMFSFFGSEKTKPENARPQNNKSHYISIKTYGTGPKLYNTSQLYLSIPLFYPMWG